MTLLICSNDNSKQDTRRLKKKKQSKHYKSDFKKKQHLRTFSKKFLGNGSDEFCE
jgi:hypothetical protein